MSEKLQINVPAYGFKILINLGNHLHNSVKYSTAEGFFIKLENWKKFITSSSNVAISLVSCMCRKNRIISTLSLAETPCFLSKSQRKTCCKMWKLQSKTFGVGNTSDKAYLSSEQWSVIITSSIFFRKSYHLGKLILAMKRPPSKFPFVHHS